MVIPHRLFSTTYRFHLQGSIDPSRWNRYNDVGNQQDATRFSFFNLFNSALHVSGDKFAHLHEHFFTVYTVKKCSWGWANLSPETCRADLKRLLKEKVVASCWLFTSLYKFHFQGSIDPWRRNTYPSQISATSRRKPEIKRIQVSFKSDKNTEHFTWISMCIYVNTSLNFSHNEKRFAQKLLRNSKHVSYSFFTFSKIVPFVR